MKNACVLGFAAITMALAGCGGGGVSIDEGPMPSGGSFTGVWHSPQYGRMEMVQTGNQVVGHYTKDERTGRIQGTARGNVMRFEWSEQRELVAGRPITTRGRGYFRYAIGEDTDHYLRGEWGVDDAISGGGEWNAVRDRRARPSVNSDGGNSGGDDSGSNFEDFDSADDSGGGGSSSGSRSGSSGGSELDLDGL